MTLWLLGRSLGLVALLGFSGSVALGVTASSVGGAHTRYVQQLLHRSLAGIGSVALVVHVATMVADSYVDVPLRSTVVPFTSGWESFAVGLGTLAGWAFVVTILSGLTRGRLAGTTVPEPLWRLLHRSAWAGWALMMAHGILAGTDTGRWWGSATYAGCAGLVAAAVTMRSMARHRREDVADPTSARWRRPTPVVHHFSAGALR